MTRRKELTDAEVEELAALCETNDVVGASFLMRCHWHESGYRTLVRRGFVKWGPPPHDFRSNTFASVEITAKGREFLAARFV